MPRRRHRRLRSCAMFSLSPSPSWPPYFSKYIHNSYKMAGRANTRKNLPELLETRSKLDDPTLPSANSTTVHLSTVRQQKKGKKQPRLTNLSFADRFEYQFPIGTACIIRYVCIHIYVRTLKGKCEKKGARRKERRERGESSDYQQMAF